MMDPEIKALILQAVGAWLDDDIGKARLDSAVLDLRLANERCLKRQVELVAENRILRQTIVMRHQDFIEGQRG